MKQFKLNTQTIKNIERSTGMTYSSLVNSDVSDIDRTIESRIGRKLKYVLTLGGLQPRGSVYMMFHRLISSSDINNRLSRIRP